MEGERIHWKALGVKKLNLIDENENGLKKVRCYFKSNLQLKHKT